MLQILATTIGRNKLPPNKYYVWVEKFSALHLAASEAPPVGGIFHASKRSRPAKLCTASAHGCIDHSYML